MPKSTGAKPFCFLLHLCFLPSKHSVRAVNPSDGHAKTRIAQSTRRSIVGWAIFHFSFGSRAEPPSSSIESMCCGSMSKRAGRTSDRCKCADSFINAQSTHTHTICSGSSGLARRVCCVVSIIPFWIIFVWIFSRVANPSSSSHRNPASNMSVLMVLRAIAGCALFFVALSCCFRVVLGRRTILPMATIPLAECAQSECRKKERALTRRRWRMARGHMTCTCTQFTRWTDVWSIHDDDVHQLQSFFRASSTLAAFSARSSRTALRIRSFQCRNCYALHWFSPSVPLSVSNTHILIPFFRSLVRSSCSPRFFLFCFLVCVHNQRLRFGWLRHLCVSTGHRQSVPSCMVFVVAVVVGELCGALTVAAETAETVSDIVTSYSLPCLSPCSPYPLHIIFCVCSMRDCELRQQSREQHQQQQQQHCCCLRFRHKKIDHINVKYNTLIVTYIDDNNSSMNLSLPLPGSVWLGLARFRI